MTFTQRVLTNVTDLRERELLASQWRLGDELDASNDGALGRPHWQIVRDYDRATDALISYRNNR